MAKPEKIKGSALTKIFEELISSQTLLKLNFPDSYHEQLTRITALANRRNEPHFIIDTPEGLENAAARPASRRMHFEFTGSDHLKYDFTAAAGEIHGRQTFVKMPSKVERNQRRKLFRIDAPAGTKLILLTGGIWPELQVVDLSIGGSLAAVVQTDSTVRLSPLFVDSLCLKDAELVFPPEILRQAIRISAIQIKRMKMNAEKKRYEVAFEFHEIDNNEERKLTDLIYRLQRQYLRRRLPLDI
jgi:c-di-GMP-binding flagellar brake protein YcgR